MQFIPRDPDLETLVGRINRGSIDLQPNFQRGEVWSKGKKQRLVDSVLRGWHIPPVHLVARESGGFDVLDGQQRLTALRDFSRGIIPVDGRIEPFDPQIAELHGLRYQELPTTVRDRYDMFSIRVLELQNYRPEEPHELFFRLNQPTSLTEAEKRNAFMGGARDQVKDLVRWAVGRGMTADGVGFSNSRLAYDDMIARFLLTLEERAITVKVTAQRVTLRYRREDGFSENVIETARRSLDFLLAMKLIRGGMGLKPNKATFHTWLCFISEIALYGDLAEFGERVEAAITFVEFGRAYRDASAASDIGAGLAVFHDRSTARVADVSSVVLRDMVAWIALNETGGSMDGLQHPAAQLALRARAVLDSRDIEKTLLEFAQEVNWGGEGWI
ncbi:DUF262 domain-containing protein [Sanguibacter sp. 25GB23B1]|uniref:DUF262 domain-containing protein n=1 Tax=unclassified Sanguibacter TaxID=2645534 RepID=UPI0032AF4728